MVYTDYKQYALHTIVYLVGGEYWLQDNTDTVNTHSRRDSYIKAGRKVLYLQDASEETADQTALVLLFFCPLCPFFIRIFIPFVGSTVHRFSNFLFFCNSLF